MVPYIPQIVNEAVDVRDYKERQASSSPRVSLCFDLQFQTLYLGLRCICIATVEPAQGCRELGTVRTCRR